MSSCFSWNMAENVSGSAGYRSGAVGVPTLTPERNANVLSGRC